jgi:legumain
MNSALFALLALAAIAVSANPLSHLSKEELATKTWVVLAAGSDGYYNYRHQADVCHAYQVVHKMGVPDERIIVMMKDDIAGNSQNPKPGQIINEPGGPDVYAGVPKDYTGNLVTSENFIKILTGTDMTGIGSGKSLKSGPDDNVFVFFDDHGSEGAICFPYGCDLDGTKMQTTINTMASNKMFKKLVIYVEACFAGSVFYKLVLPKNVYVTTAAPVGESSFAFNWDDTIRAYVADVYSYLWIHDTEINGQGKHTFQDQFDYIQQNIEGYSQTCQYGDKNMESVYLTDFFNPTSASVSSKPVKVADAVSTFDVPLMTAKRVFMAEPTDENLKELNKQIAIKKAVDDMASAIVNAAKPNAPHLGMPACSSCDSSCNCYKYCIGEHNAEYCAMECCNEQGCYVDPPSANSNAEKHDSCVHELAQEFLAGCGNDHAYLRKAELLFRRVCRQPDADVKAAVAEIRRQCVAFNAMAF